MLNWMGRTALELIGQAGLGYSFDPLQEDVPPDVFAEAIKAYVSVISPLPRSCGGRPLTLHLPARRPALYDLSVFRWAMPYVSHFGTSAFRRKVLEWIPFKRLHRLKHVVDTMHRRAAEIYHEKKILFEHGDEALLMQVGEGKDLMSILREQALLGCTPQLACSFVSPCRFQ